MTTMMAFCAVSSLIRSGTCLQPPMPADCIHSQGERVANPTLKEFEQGERGN